MKIVLIIFPLPTSPCSSWTNRSTEGERTVQPRVLWTRVQSREREEAHKQPFELGVGGWEAKTCAVISLWLRCVRAPRPPAHRALGSLSTLQIVLPEYCSFVTILQYSLFVESERPFQRRSLLPSALQNHLRRSRPNNTANHGSCDYTTSKCQRINIPFTHTPEVIRPKR